jgi:hypothetical protein
MLVGGGNAVTSYWDNFAVENKAYDTMNADPSGQAFALAGRTVSVNVVAAPSAFSVSDFAALAVVRFDHAYSVTRAVDRYLVEVYVDGNNRVALVFSQGSVAFGVAKVRNGAVAQILETVPSNFAAGDTIAVAMKVSPTAGLTLYVSKNGAAVTTQTIATPEALLSITGTPTVGIGKYGGGTGQEPDATFGTVRILKGGLSDATISARVLDPYGVPDDNDLAVWGFEGFAFQVPAYNDRLVKLGTSYDYRTVGTAAAATPTQSTGEQISGSVAASAVDAWWLRDATDSTKDVQLYVRHDTGYEFERGRPTSVGTPLQGGPRSVIYGATPFGDEGRLALIYPTAALRDSTEAALKTLLATNNATWLQDPFGGLRRVRISAPIRFRPQLTPADLESDLDFIEVPA